MNSGDQAIMSFDDFPSEILERIFAKLSSGDLLSCEHVCRRWEVEAKAVHEARWRRACIKDFPGAYAEARRKSKYKLSWQELHRSLSLWPQIASASMTHYISGDIDEINGWRGCGTRDHPRQFNVLSNGLISIPMYTDDEDNRFGMFDGETNTVLYLDIDTLQNRNTQKYTFKFDTYEENDDIVVFRGKLNKNEGMNKLIIGIKENGKVGKLYPVGDLKAYMWGDTSNFTRVNNSVYYRDKNNVICVAKPVETAEGKRVVSKPLVMFNDSEGHRVDFKIAAVAEISGDVVHVLTDRGQVYAAANSQYTYLGRVEKNMHNRAEVVDNLSAYGFEWSSRDVFRWIKDSDIIDGDWVAITKTKKAILKRQDRVVVVATIIRTIHLFYNPYNKRTGKLNLYNAKPTRKVDLRDLIDFDEDMYSEVKRVSQIDIVETRCGHKVILLVAEMIVILNFKHVPAATAPTEAKRPRLE